MTAWPLALCDAGSVSPSELVPKEQIRRDFTGESYLARFNAEHKWCYLGQMRRDEVVVMKIFDSERKEEGGANCCVHCSFEFRAYCRP